MTILSKTSNWALSRYNKIEDYVKKLDYDLQQLFNRFSTLFHVNSLQVGGSTSYASISSGGFVTLSSAAICKLAMRPAFVAGRIGGIVKPTSVTLGVWAGYSCPIFNNDDEELFWRLHVPGRWDGKSDIDYHLIVCLAEAQSAGNQFAFQVSWNHSDNTTASISTAAVQNLVTGATCLAGHIGKYSIFKLDYMIDWDIDTPDITTADTLTARVRRVATGNTGLTDEVIVLDHWLNFHVDKMFKTLS